MSYTSTFPRRASRAGSIAMACRRLVTDLRTGIGYAMDAWATQRAIRALQSLDDHMLQDIGLTRSEIASRVRQHAWW